MTSIDAAKEERQMEEQDREDEVYRPLKDDGADTSHLITPEEMHAEAEKYRRLAALHRHWRDDAHAQHMRRQVNRRIGYRR
jgi:hypothetical protein